MDRGLSELTDKEKQTLRLLAGGHDAKSAARTLELSVHTINERLRHARRKLDVTSSREAARLLVDAEQDDPQNPGYTRLGDAPRPAVSDKPAIGEPANRVALLIGGSVMMLTTTLAAALLLSPSPQRERPIGDPASSIEAAQLEEFENAARGWLALVDAFDWQASLAATGETFRTLNTLEMWREASLQARVPLGEVIERRVQTAEHVAAPPRGYVTVKFRTDFANRADTHEAVTLVREASGWKVVGYMID